MTDLANLAGSLRSERLTRTALADGTGVILDVDGMHVLTLNETGQFIVERLCDGVERLDGIVAAIVAEFEIDEPTAHADAVAFLDELERFVLPGRV